MNSGGIFKLIVNDGNRDRILVNSGLLNDYLFLFKNKNIKQIQLVLNKQDITVADLEKTIKPLKSLFDLCILFIEKDSLLSEKLRKVCPIDIIEKFDIKKHKIS